MRHRLITLATASLLAVGSSSVDAQVFAGRIDVTIEDATGGRLPGVIVALTGPAAETQMADVQGQVHFLNLPVGTYAVEATLPGFNPYINAQVEVTAGAATPLRIKLAAAGTAETVVVVAATSVIDLTRETTTTNMTLEELQSIPTARDPWAVLQTIPTISVDRVNVGGSESGQQSVYVGKGSVPTDNTWHIDGVPITDMGSTGSSPTYYDFDMFKAIAITTGGANAQNPTPGVQMNLVLKKGANTPHGSGRMYFENERLQSTNIPADLVARLGGAGEKGNRTDRLMDYGGEIGGPIQKDRWWGWASIGRTDVRNLTLTSQLDETILRNYAFKVDGQPRPYLRTNVTVFEGNRIKNGRDVGITRPIETAWNESGPTRYYKGEGNLVVRQNLFALARVAYISGGTELRPIGGLDKNMYQDASLVWHNSFYFTKSQKPQRYAGADGSYFIGRHELKFGFAWRKAPVRSLSIVPGSKIITYWAGYPFMEAIVQQDYALNTTGRYTNLFITDTIPFGRLTVIAGIRHDHQSSSLNETSIPAVQNFPLLPAVTGSPVENAYNFNNITPRVGMTYALDEPRKTVVRASYAMFASQLPANAAGFISPIQPYTYVIYEARDTNGNGFADLNEIDFAAGAIGSSNIDLAHPGVFITANRIRDISAPRTLEILAGVDREFVANFAASATLTYRYMNNFLWNPPIGVGPTNYRQTGVFSRNFPDLGLITVPVYGISVGQVGREARNREGYHRRYIAVEASATKRMANRWMARVGFASSAWAEYFDDPSRSILDPTRTPVASDQYADFTASGPLVNAGPVVVSTEGTGKSGIYLLAPKYQLAASGSYQGPLGINFAGNLLVRQGYGEPFFRSRVPAQDSLVPAKTALLVKRPDQFRLDAVKLLDIRVEKIFTIRDTSLAFDFDVFNLLNNGTVLGRQYDARSTAFQQVLEIMNPRVARLGVRFFF